MSEIERAQESVDRLAEEQLPFLTEDEITALFEQPDKGIESAPMQDFNNLDEFKEGANNFPLHFTSTEGSFSWRIYKRQKAFQRFAVLYPVFVDQLIQRIQGKKFADPDEDESAWSDLYWAYQQMSKLVDEKDNDAMRNGKVNERHLIQ